LLDSLLQEIKLNKSCFLLIAVNLLTAQFSSLSGGEWGQ